MNCSGNHPCFLDMPGDRPGIFGTLEGGRLGIDGSRGPSTILISREWRSQ